MDGSIIVLSIGYLQRSMAEKIYAKWLMMNVSAIYQIIVV